MQAISYSEMVNGDFTTWEYPNISYNDKVWFEKYLKPYMANVSICKNDKNKRCNYYARRNGNNWSINEGEYYTDNLFAFQYLWSMGGLSVTRIVKSSLNEYAVLQIEVTPRHFLKKPLVGRDVFTFVIYHDLKGETSGVWLGLVPGARPLLPTSKDAYKKTIELCAKGNPDNNGTWICGQIIQMNGWKIPDEYPIRF